MHLLRLGGEQHFPCSPQPGSARGTRIGQGSRTGSFAGQRASVRPPEDRKQMETGTNGLFEVFLLFHPRSGAGVGNSIGVRLQVFLFLSSFMVFTSYGGAAIQA